MTLAVSVLIALVTMLSVGHVLLNKRDPKSAWGWVAVCLMLPGGGAALYWLMGVNRIKTRARNWEAEGRFDRLRTPAAAGSEPPSGDSALAALVRVGDRVTGQPLVPGNRVSVLHNGEAAFPAMLDAIANARERICLSTYIFRTDGIGGRFIDALAAAAARGVAVRVLIDGVGELYTFPWPSDRLRHTKVRVARFLPLVRRGFHLNLRNHRKLLIVDGRQAFTGGMNIGDHHLAERKDNPHRVVDLQVGVEGPVVAELEAVFFRDWHFTTGEAPAVPPGQAIASAGTVSCRGISAGPNEDFEKLYWIVLGAVGAARSHIRIMTPYFIPDRALLAALTMAALRDVRVEIVLPQQNNLPYVAWAMRALLWEVLQYGARVYDQPGPFVHSKLLAVDDMYALVGSANLDPRSLRLNFEFNLEICDREAAALLTRHFDATRDRSREVTLAEIDARPLPIRLRDGAAKLLSPYL